MNQSILLICLLLSCVTCTKNDMPEDSSSQENLPPNTIYSGSVYFACEYGPYTFLIDSLISNCSQEFGIMDSLSNIHIAKNDTIHARCNYDMNFNQLTSSNWDFQVSRTEDGLAFNTEWPNSNPLINPLTATVDDSLLQANSYPFYNGHTITLSDEKELRLLFFNTYIGGCFHDLMVWELESEE